MNRITPQPDFSDPRNSENNPHKKRNEGRQQPDVKMLVAQARRELVSIKEAAVRDDIDVNGAIVGIMKATGIALNLIEICSEASALAMRDGDAAREVMKQVGRESRETLATYKEEINQLKQRVTELEKGKQ